MESMESALNSSMINIIEPLFQTDSFINNQHNMMTSFQNSQNLCSKKSMQLFNFKTTLNIEENLWNNRKEYSQNHKTMESAAVDLRPCVLHSKIDAMIKYYYINKFVHYCSKPRHPANVHLF